MNRLANRLHVDGIPSRLWVQAVLVFAVVTTLVLTSIGTVVLLRNSQRAAKDRRVAAASLRLLVECTTAPAQRIPPERHVPADDCYLRQQKAAGAFTDPTGPLAALVAAAAACGSAHPGDIPATRGCIVKGLSR